MSNQYTPLRPKSLGTPFIVGLFLLLPIALWWLVDLFFVAAWVREHNTAAGHG